MHVLTLPFLNLNCEDENLTFIIIAPLSEGPMEFGLLQILQLTGAVVLFLYGMRLLSESMQRVAGEGLRNILRSMTKNHFTGIMSGLLVTAIIQSSSASTVMFVSFVNAGLLSLTESISLILGANVGTTITTWLIGILGFKIEIGAICLPMMAISFPLLFSRKNKLRSWGEVLFGFSLLFLGLDFMKLTVPDIHDQPEVLSFLSNYTAGGNGSVLLFILVGVVLTLIVQSSSAMLALIIVMCGNGWIGFEMGAAMIIGSNIGTTLTANIAALVANRKAKKAAFSHFMFNLMAALFSTLMFTFLVKLSSSITFRIENSSPMNDLAAIPIGLAVFHTLFNLFNLLLLVWFIEPWVGLINRIFPEKTDRGSGLKYITTGLLSTSEMSLLQARKEVLNFADLTNSMYTISKNLFAETDSEKQGILLGQLEEKEIRMDSNEVEIAAYLAKLSESDLSIAASRRIRSLLKISDNMESIADTCYNLGRILQRKNEHRVWFTPDLRKEVWDMFDLLDQAFACLHANLHADREGRLPDMEKAYSIEIKINKHRNKLKDVNMENIRKKEYPYQAGVVFLDIVSLCENMGDHLINISEALQD
ncbi:MAG: Na/Pi cotransporter family protein [Bacteroidota bacterium]